MKKIASKLVRMVSGKDGELSLRRVLAVSFSIALMLMAFLVPNAQEAFIWAFASLIVALLGLTTFQNLKDNGAHNSTDNNNDNHL